MNQNVRDKMKAIICPKYGSAEVLKLVDCKKPKPKENEVLIKIYASSVTNSDLFIRSSNVATPLIIPFRLMIGILKPRNEIIGEVFAGVIEEIGSKIKRFNIGDKVYGLTGMSLGAYADYKCMTEKDSKKGCVAIMPNNVSFEEATSAAYGGLLALQSLEKGKIEIRKKVLVYGASGTTGTMAIQIINSLGIEVTGICSKKHIDFIKSLGANKIIDYSDDQSIGYLEKYDLILDAVGRNKSSKLKILCKSALLKNGVYVSIDDEPLECDSNRLNRISKMIESKNLKPINDRIYELKDIVEAHKYVEVGHKLGNVAIKINYI
jgi:NADPH:quinone reductase-like Zn-dependent oxidoreductase